MTRSRASPLSPTHDATPHGNVLDGQVATHYHGCLLLLLRQVAVPVAVRKRSPVAFIAPMARYKTLSL